MLKGRKPLLLIIWKLTPVYLLEIISQGNSFKELYDIAVIISLCWTSKQTNMLSKLWIRFVSLFFMLKFCCTWENGFIPFAFFLNITLPFILFLEKIFSWNCEKYFDFSNFWLPYNKRTQKSGLKCYIQFYKGVHSISSSSIWMRFLMIHQYKGKL